MLQTNKADRPAAKRPQALIVEDEELVLAFVETVLQQESYETIICTRGDQAIAYLQTNTPDLIFLDSKLPDMFGEQVLQWIAQESRLHNTSVVMMSGGLLETDKAYGQVAAFLPKPFGFHQLREIAVMGIFRLHGQERYRFE